MKAVYIVNVLNVVRILVDPMQRAILDLLRQRPMTQTQLGYVLGLIGASLNYHMKKAQIKGAYGCSEERGRG
jgi:predicted transcriptional regulator